MFYKENLSKFRYFRVYSDRMNGRHGQRDYVFLEDKDDIAGTDLIPYENFIEPNATGKVVKFVGLGVGTPLYELFYLQTINDILKISVEIYQGNRQSALLAVARGQYDIYVMGVKGYSQTNSLLSVASDETSIFVKNLEYKSSQYFFLNTFTFELWMCYLSVLVLSALLCWGFQRILRRILQQPYIISFDIFTFISLLFGQGGGIFEKSVLSLKLILITYLGVLIVFYGSFDAFLSALLAIQKLSLPFSDLDGLLQQPDYVLCYWDPNNLKSHITSYPRGFYNISVEINHPSACPGTSTNLLEFFDSNFTCDYEKLAFIADAVMLDNIKSKCDLTIPLPGKYFVQVRSCFVYSGFLFKQQFNVLILKMKSSGVFDLFLRRIKTVYRNEHSTEQTLVSIDLNHISLMLYLLIIGIICAVAVLVGEIVHAKMANRNQNMLFKTSPRIVKEN